MSVGETLRVMTPRLYIAERSLNNPIHATDSQPAFCGSVKCTANKLYLQQVTIFSQVEISTEPGFLPTDNFY